MRRIASNYIILSSTNIIKQGIIKIENNQLVEVSSLTEEVESASWFSGILLISSSPIDLSSIKCKLKKANGGNLITILCDYFSNIKIGDNIYTYAINNVDLNTFTILDDANIDELK